MSEAGAVSKVKQRRATRACDFCHRRGLKCRPTEPPSSSCATCIEYHTECTSTRKVVKRGKKPTKSSPAAGETVGTKVDFNRFNIPVQTTVSVQNEKQSDDLRERCRKIDADGSHLDWVGRIDERRLGHRFQLAVLVDVYFDTIFPLYPFFDEDTFRGLWSDPKYPYSRSTYVTLMALLALSARNIEDRTIFTPILKLVEQPSLPTSEQFLAEALQVLPKDLGECKDFEYARSLGLIVLCAAKMEKKAVFHQYLGLYHALLAHNDIADERRWPIFLSALERKIWRRFMWTMYRIEIQAAVVQGNMVRIPHNQLLIAIPYETEEESVTAHWMTGWNFVTTIYQTLEYVWVQHLILICKRTPVMGIPPLLDLPTQIIRLQELLPIKFQAIMQNPRDLNDVRVNMQIAEIMLMLQFLQNISNFTEEGNFEEVFQAAQFEIQNMTIIPEEYLRTLGLARLPVDPESTMVIEDRGGRYG
ncbi:hypothetical protein BP6252_09073 [Coleophoma cylindrospora]|uniref:Zn(2)-C6 fungal-type domain-containing protein n=1 Tax=Coleophoma cylindrospora TaxID=1849047 RepID=A0A3D8R0W2_9HELO|nr:hypothetical protein BP6252_09073 [Coleophoma cylindrospora]